jgi:uncharacterized membrane protein YfcA
LAGWPLSLLGAVLGSNVVLAVAPQTLRIVVLVLLVVALILGCAGPMGRAEPIACARPQRRVGGTVALFALGVYSGFLGTGYGAFLMYALMYFYDLPLLASAAAMTRISLLVTGAAVVSFIAKGTVMYSVAVPLALGCAAGGLAGAVLARRCASQGIRWVFLSASVLLTVRLGWDVYRGM